MYASKYRDNFIENIELSELPLFKAMMKAVTHIYGECPVIVRGEAYTSYGLLLPNKVAILRKKKKPTKEEIVLRRMYVETFRSGFSEPITVAVKPQPVEKVNWLIKLLIAKRISRKRYIKLLISWGISMNDAVCQAKEDITKYGAYKTAVIYRLFGLNNEEPILKRL